MKKGLEETAGRTRNIRWLVTTDETAKALAIKHGIGVSRLLELLVLEEARNPRIPNHKALKLKSWEISP